MDDPILSAARSLVEEKSPHIDAEAKEIMTNEVALAIEDHINAELLNRLSAEQVEQFNREVTDDTSEDEALAFFTRAGVDINDAVTVALRRFKRAYLGV